MNDGSNEIRRLEALAEAAYEAMYDAHPRAVKDLYEDARLYLGKAIAMAESAGLRGESARLSDRRDHIAAVYDRQFRNIGL